MFLSSLEVFHEAKRESAFLRHEYKVPSKFFISIKERKTLDAVEEEGRSVRATRCFDKLQDLIRPSEGAQVGDSDLKRQVTLLMLFELSWKIRKECVFDDLL